MYAFPAKKKKQNTPSYQLGWKVSVKERLTSYEQLANRLGLYFGGNPQKRATLIPEPVPLQAGSKEAEKRIQSFTLWPAVAHCQWLPGSSELKVTRSGWLISLITLPRVKGLKLFEFKANLVSWVDSGRGHTERPYLKRCVCVGGELAFTLLCGAGKASKQDTLVL